MVCACPQKTSQRSVTNVHKRPGRSWQEGERAYMKCFMRAKEESPASKFYGLHPKTILSTPAAWPTDNSYLEIQQRDFFEFYYYYSFKITVIDIHLKLRFFMGGWDG